MTVNGYLFAAYTVIWTILFIFVWLVHRRQKELAQELKDISDRLEKRSQSNGQL